MNNNNNINILYDTGLYNENSVTIFNTICGNRFATILLEYKKKNSIKEKKSIIITDSSLRITLLNKYVKIETLTNNGRILLSFIIKKLPYSIKIEKTLSTNNKLFFYYDINSYYFIDEDSKLESKSSFDILRFLIKFFKDYKENKSIFFGGLFSYDLIYNFEKLPQVKKIYNCPEYCFYLAETLITLNHKKKKCKLTAISFSNNSFEINKLKFRLNSIKKKLKNINNDYYNNISNKNKFISCNIDDNKYCKNIIKLQNLIKEGEIFQVVPSRIFLIECSNPLLSYEKLKSDNPSPYMFFMQDYNFILFGSSPESALKYNPTNRKISIYPIAGTRYRGIDSKGILNTDLDNRIELELKTDAKELAEHLMLVDLARNDLAKICKTGTRRVSKLLSVDKYSFVMHLVSKVVGILKENLDIFHAYQACMNMGTLTGAPKIRAMQLIAKTEKIQRGVYGGAIGYFTASEILDTCIIIRSAYIEQGIARIQAGAGIVLNSFPQEEANESFNKAKAVLNSIKNT